MNWEDFVHALGSVRPGIVSASCQTYLDAERKCEFKYGDRVRIIRKAESCEGGWNNTWISPDMDKLVGLAGVVQSTSTFGQGVKVAVHGSDDAVHYCFPFFVLEKIGNTEGSMENMTEMERVYVDAQKNCGIEAGDCVKVIRKAKDHEAGWGALWTQPMGAYVGKIGRVIRVHSDGISVSFQDGRDYSFPYFVLEKTTPEFVPFQKVLVRDNRNERWAAAFFSHRDEDGAFVTAGGIEWEQCIPYEGNEQRLGTTD